MSPRDTYDVLAFGRTLHLGQPVLVAWGYGSGFRAMGRGTIQKINRRSVRVRLTEPVASPFDDKSSHTACWPIGQTITVVRPDDITNPKLHPNNTVHPLPSPSETLSYGVRCAYCNQLETACICGAL